MAETATKGGGMGVSGQARSITATRTALVVLSILALVGVLVICGGCDNESTISPVVSGSAETVQPSTTQPGAEPEAQATGAESSAAAPETAPTGQDPDVLLGMDDFGTQVLLHVGDRVRVVLEPKVTSGVRAVSWEFMPYVVQEVDSGADMVGDRVVKCWLELEAVTPGPVTVRAVYQYQVKTDAKWVVYITVKE
jgi:hypothetical protein